MTSEAQTHWHQHRMAIVVSQLAPTFLLISTIALLQFGLAETDLAVRVATAGILLASGILGAVVQFHSAQEATALASGLTEDTPSQRSIRSSARWMWVVQYVTPSVFIVIYIALMFALFS
jgi:SNF family Na+-dependent transporter